MMIIIMSEIMTIMIMKIMAIKGTIMMTLRGRAQYPTPGQFAGPHILILAVLEFYISPGSDTDHPRLVPLSDTVQHLPDLLPPLPCHLPPLDLCLYLQGLRDEVPGTGGIICCYLHPIHVAGHSLLSFPGNVPVTGHCVRPQGATVMLGLHHRPMTPCPSKTRVTRERNCQVSAY